MAASVIYLILIGIVVSRFLRQKNGRGSASGHKASGGAFSGSVTSAGKSLVGKMSASGPLASDGHRVSKEQDVSCRRFGHNHEEFDTPRYIPHTDPEDGYIVLNGVKMKLSEADRYEDRI